MGVSKNGGTQQPWGFPTINDHFGVLWGYHYFRRHPYIQGCRLLNRKPNRNWYVLVTIGTKHSMLDWPKVLASLMPLGSRVKKNRHTFMGTNISHIPALLKISFLFPRWDVSFVKGNLAPYFIISSNNVSLMSALAHGIHVWYIYLHLP